MDQEREKLYPIKWVPIRDKSYPVNSTEIVIIYRCSQCKTLIAFDRDYLMQQSSFASCSRCRHEYDLDLETVKL